MHHDMRWVILKELLSGNLIIIGGAEDKEGRKEILKKFVVALIRIKIFY